MADIGKTLSGLWAKGVSGIGNTANNIAKTANFKAEEMNLNAQRRELFASIGEKAYSLYEEGASFPEELEAILHQIHMLDTQLNDLRAEYKQQPEKAAPSIPEIAVQPAATSVYDSTPIAERKAPSLEMPVVSHPAEVPDESEEIVMPVSQHQAPKIDVDAAYSAAEEQADN